MMEQFSGKTQQNLVTGRVQGEAQTGLDCGMQMAVQTP